MVSYEIVFEHQSTKRLFIFGTSKPSLPVVLGGKEVYEPSQPKNQESEADTLSVLQNHISNLKKQSPGKKSIFFATCDPKSEFGRFIMPLLEKLQEQVVSKVEDPLQTESGNSFFLHHFREGYQDLLNGKQTFLGNYLQSSLVAQIAEVSNSQGDPSELILNRNWSKLDSRLHFININTPLQSGEVPTIVISVIVRICLQKQEFFLPEILKQSLLRLEESLNFRTDEVRAGVLRHVRTSTDPYAINLPDESPRDPNLTKQVSSQFRQIMVKRKFQYLLKKVRKLRLLLMTWNLAGILPEDRNLPDLQGLFKAGEYPDLLVFGFQEILEAKFGNVAKNMFGSSAEQIANKWVEVLQQRLTALWPGRYTLLTSESSLTMLMVVFVESQSSGDIVHKGTSQVKDGIRGLVGTKRSFICNLEFKGNLMMLCTTHLSAGDDPKPRQEMIAELQEKLCKENETSLSFLFGDLNMRVRMPDKEYSDLIKDRIADNPQIPWDRIYLFDEIKRGDQPGLKLKEADISFPATFKLDVKEGVPTYKEDRQASWCDRILYWKPPKDQIHVECLKYDSLRSNLSDHR